MGFLDRLLGRDEPAAQTAAPPLRSTGGTDDERAVERYRYLLRTAPPEQIEQAHAEAFANLTPDQRREVLTSLSAQDPQGARGQGDDPASLARMATRAEMRQPGTLERSFSGGGMGGGMGMGGWLAGSLLASVAGSFIGTSIAASMFDDSGDQAGGEGDGGESGEGDGGESGGGYGEDPAAAESGGDYAGDGGGDFGGGDFGGGDFGGGEF